MSLQFGAFVFREGEKKKKWISIPSHHHSPDGPGHEHVCVSVCAWEKTGACACVWGGGMREGITCRNRNGSTETQHWLDFLIASRLRRMADAAVCANSCSPKKNGPNKLWQAAKEQCRMNHVRPMRYFAISQVWKMRAGLRIAFIGGSHLLRGAFPRELAKMHSLCCLGKTETVWCVPA